MNQPNGPVVRDLSPQFQFTIRSFLIAIALLAYGVALIKLNVSESQRSLNPGSPWPDTVLALFMLVWFLNFIGFTVAMFTIRDKMLKYVVRVLAGGALVAVVANAYFWARVVAGV